MARSSGVEVRIAKQHGDPQVVIPAAANAGTLEDAARKLDVRQSWLSNWLARNGYRREVRWVKEGGDQQQQ